MAQFKHLSIIDRQTIARLLSDNATLTEIANSLGRDVSTIRNEIKKHRKEKKQAPVGRIYNNCKHRMHCKLKGLCDLCRNHSSKCGRCQRCNQFCSHYESEFCQRRDKKPYCCNGCNDLPKCVLTKYIYEPQTAQNEYRETLSSCREGFNISPEEVQVLGVLVDKLIRDQGQSINAAVANNEDEFTVSSRTLYTYIDAGLFNTRNIDLARKVRLMPRSSKPHHKVDRKCTENRKYEDFLKHMEINPDLDVVEFDSVEGKKGGSVLLTMYFRSCSTQLSFKRASNNARSVQEIVDTLYLKLGHDMFTRLFPVILADNGSEFSNPKAIENYITVDDETGEVRETPRTKVFYCDPSAPYQKGSCERNHEFIRYFIPKGSSFDPYSQQQIDLMMNHINNYVREKMNRKSPASRFIFLYGEDTAKILGILLIDPNDVTLNNAIFK